MVGSPVGVVRPVATIAAGVSGKGRPRPFRRGGRLFFPFVELEAGGRGGLEKMADPRCQTWRGGRSLVSRVVSPPHRRGSVPWPHRCDPMLGSPRYRVRFSGSGASGLGYPWRVNRRLVRLGWQPITFVPGDDIRTFPRRAGYLDSRDARPEGLTGGLNPTVSQPRGGWPDSSGTNLRRKVARVRFRMTPVASRPGKLDGYSESQWSARSFRSRVMPVRCG